MWGDREGKGGNRGDAGKGGDRPWVNRSEGGGKGGDRPWVDRGAGGKGENRPWVDKGAGKGGDRPWVGRRDRDDRLADEERPQQHQHNLEGGVRSQITDPIRSVEIDALVFLQIMKHCTQHTPHPVTGMLLGLDVDDTLQVTHSFGYVQRSSEDPQGGHDDGTQYQVDTLKKLREVNVDSNTVGWYQTTHLGQFFSSTVIDTQFLYQTEIARSVLLVYDSLQSAIGKPSFKALQLTPEFMKRYSEASEAGRIAMADFPSHDMFKEIPVSISSSVIAEAFLVDWAISDPFSTSSQVGILDVENQAYLQKNVRLLIQSLQDLAEEQRKLLEYERMNSKKGDAQQKGGRNNRFQQIPRQLDTMILSQQIQNYCKAINGFAGDAFGKIYLMSNKPSGVGRK